MHVDSQAMDSNDFARVRRHHQLSQVKLAGFLGVNQAQVSRWERGVQPIPLWTEKLLDCLGMLEDAPGMSRFDPVDDGK